MIRTRRTYRYRPGFTLVELMVVIVIIGILAALTASGAFMVITTMQNKTTITNIQKVSDALNQQWQAVIDQAKTEDSTPAMSLAGGDPRRAQVIWIHFRLQQEFPMNYTEALGGVSGYLSAKTSYQTLISQAVSAKTNPNAVSSACLLMALSQGRRGMVFHAEDALGAASIRDTDGDGLPEIVDAWGQPLGFWRWPVGIPDFASITTMNPLDPEGTLSDPSWTGLATFQAALGIAPYSIVASSPNYNVPVIGSSGKNMKWGVQWLSMTITTPNDANDNLYNYNLRVGASGN